MSACSPTPATRPSTPDLEELFTQYGRYLLISSSRPGGLPANLQGVWNESNDPPWRSDYHSNINIQMNYWLAEPTNLSELHMPMIDYFVAQAPIARLRTREDPDFKPRIRGWTVRTENGVFGGGSWNWNPRAAPGTRSMSGALRLQSGQDLLAHGRLSLPQGNLPVLGRHAGRAA